MANENNNEFTPSYRILKAADKQVTAVEASANGLLAGLWRKILYDMGITPVRWNILIDEYLDKQSGNKTNRFDRANTRSALNSELFEPAMTMKTLIKGLKVLNCDDLQIQISVTKRNKKGTTVFGGILNPDHLASLLQEPLFRENKKPQKKVEAVDENYTQPKSSMTQKTPVTAEATDVVTEEAQASSVKAEEVKELPKPMLTKAPKAKVAKPKATKVKTVNNKPKATGKRKAKAGGKQ